MKWEEEVESVVKQRNVTSDTITGKYGNGKRWTTGKLTDTVHNNQGRSNSEMRNLYPTWNGCIGDVLV